MAMGNVFDPVKLSLDENAFLLEVVGKAPVAVKKMIPAGINARAILPVVEKVYELIELEREDGSQWVGVEAVKASIQTYLAQANKWSKDKRRGKRRFPSLFSYDARGRAFRGGPGSDSDQVRTYFDPATGERKKLAIELIKDVNAEWQAPTEEATAPVTVGSEAPVTDGLTHNVDMRRFECFCGHTEQYKPGSRQSENFARSRMSRHLRTAKEEVEKHREIHTLEFGSPAIGSGN